MAGQYRFKDDSGNIVAQISASVEGAIAFSGSVVDFTQANNVILGNVQLAGTASNALLLDGFDSQAFAFTSSIHPFTASIAGTNTFTSSATARLNSIETISASNISRLNSIETITASNIARLNSIETITSSNVARLNSLEIKTGSLATTGSNTFIGTQTITGSLYISSDLIVQGSSSLQNITASAVSIGTNIINLNTANPAIRYAGLSIGDSGSVGGSGSFLYDSVQDEMIFVHRGANTTVTSSVVLMGPQTYDTIGSESYLTNNRLVKGTGNEHIVDSNISDSGTLVTINSVTSSFSGIVGIGTTSPASRLEVSDTQTTTPQFQIRETSSAYHRFGILKSGSFVHFVEPGNDGTAASEYLMTINMNGNNVGIGTNNPSVLLDVQGAASNEAKLNVIITGAWGGASNQDHGIVISGARYANDTNTTLLHIKNNDATSLFRVTDYGKVAIGNTNPQATLHLGASLNTLPSATSIAVAGDTSIRFTGGSDGNSNYGSYIAGTQYSGVRALSLGSRQGAGDVLAMTITEGKVGIGTTNPSHKLHVYDNSASGVRGLRVVTDSSTVGPTIRMDYGPGGLRNWLIGTSYEYSNDFEIRVSNANSGDPGADGSSRFILWADGGYSNTSRSIGNLSSTSLAGFSSANVQRWSFASLCDNTWRTLVSSVNGIHGVLKISGTDAGTKNYGEWFVTFSFPAYGVMNFVQLHYSGGGWNTGGFELTYSNTGSDYFLQFRNTSYYGTGNTAGYNMEFTAL